MRTTPMTRLFVVGVLVAIGALSQTVGNAASDKRPYTVEDMLGLEDIGKAQFADAGQKLIFEHVEAYGNAAGYGRGAMFGRDRTKLYVVDVQKPDRVKPLFRQQADFGYWQGPVSPNGLLVPVFWFDGNSVKAGVFDLKREKLHTFSVSPELQPFLSNHPIWLSNEEVIYFTLPPGQKSLSTEYLRKSAEQLPALSSRGWDGQESSAQVLGGGSHVGAGRPDGGRVFKVNVRTGKAEQIGEGAFVEFASSPDGRYVAGLRRSGFLRPKANRPLDPSLFGALELVLFDLQKRGETIVCADCKAFPRSLKWAPSGHTFVFAATRTDDDSGEIKVFQYDLAEATLVEPLPKREAASTNDHFFGFMPQHANVVWIGDKLASAMPAAAGEATRSDWFVLAGNNEPVNLTSSFERPPWGITATWNGHGFVVADGNVWRLSADGQPSNLTSDIRSPLVAAHYPGPEDSLQSRYMLLQALPTEEKNELVFLDLETGRSEVFADGQKDDRVLASSHLGNAVLVRRNSSSGDTISFIFSDGSSHPVFSINQHLASVEEGQRVKIDYEGPGGQPMVDWMLLPPGHQEGDRHPLVVVFYPGEMRSPERPEQGPFDATRGIIFFNTHILSGKGYAVLQPSVPLAAPMGQAGEPLNGLAATVVAAAERAVDAGYADPVRWAVMGQSYGGYGTMGVIAHTDRFKAAVSSAGSSNLTSGYGIFDRRFIADTHDIDKLYGAAWAENGQGRMGAAPWQDPDRYVRNSPLFSADKIQTPLLLTHGDLDGGSVTQSEEMFTALFRQGKDVLFVRYWGEDHVIESPANIRDYWLRVFGWYDQYLGPETEKQNAAPKSP